MRWEAAVIALVAVASVSQGAVVEPTDGLGVAERVDRGWEPWPGGLRIGHPLLGAVDLEGDGRTELLGYEGSRPVVYGPGLERVLSPADGTLGATAAVDVTGDGLLDLLVASRGALTVVDARSRLAERSHATGFQEVYGAEVVPTDDGGSALMLIGPAATEERRVRVESRALPGLDLEWAAETDGYLRTWDMTADGAVIARGRVCSGCSPTQQATFLDPGGMRWTHDLPYVSHAVGWLGEDRVYYVDGRDHLYVVEASTGEVVADVLVPAFHMGARTTHAVVADVDLDGANDLVVATGNYYFNSWYQNHASSYLWVLDGATFSWKLFGKVEGHARHLAVDDLDGDGWPDVVAATVTGSPVPVTPASNAPLGIREWFPGAVTVSAVTVSAYQGPLMDLKWLETFPSGGVMGWQYAYHRGVAVAHVGPGGTKAVAVLRDWAGALDLLDPSDGSLLERRESLGETFDARSGPCGVAAAHLTGHVSLQAGTVTALLQGVPVQVAPTDDCGAYAVTPAELYRVDADGRVLWSRVLTAAPSRLDALGGDAVVATLDGVVTRYSEDGSLLWARPLSLARNEVTSDLHLTPDGVFVATCPSARVTIQAPRDTPLESDRIELPGNAVRLLDAATGEERWVVDAHACPRAPTLHGGALAFAVVGGAVGVDPASGAVLWERELAGTTLEAWALVDGSLAVHGAGVNEDGEAWFDLAVVHGDGSVEGSTVLEINRSRYLMGVGRWMGGEVVAAVWDPYDDRTMLRGLDGSSKGSFLQTIPPTSNWVFGGWGFDGAAEYGGCVDDAVGILCWGRLGESSVLHLVPDAAAPSVAVTHAPATAAPGETVLLHGTVDEDVRVSFGSARASVGGESVAAALVVSGGTWSVELGPLPAAHESDPYVVTVRVVDSAGRVGGASVEVASAPQ